MSTVKGPLTIHHAIIRVSRPTEFDQGRVEASHYTVQGNKVALTDEHGVPYGPWQVEIEEGDDALVLARQLLWRRYDSEAQEVEFNRPLSWDPRMVPW